MQNNARRGAGPCALAMLNGVTAISHRLVAALLTMLIFSTGFIAADVRADPASDELAQLNNLSREAIVTFYSDVSHAGIYIGDGMVVHASTYGTPVRVAPVDSSPLHNVRRY